MDNKTNMNETLSRMKALMGYGLQTESKKTPFSSIENQRLGADGKYYAIIREGANYFIKVAPNKANLVKEDYNYIGGFRNRKDYQYDSFANAQKQFDLKMMSLKEAANRTDIDTSSWNLDKKEDVIVEATEKMKNELLRERQIMKNAMLINEKKAVCCDAPKSAKDNIKGEKPETGNAENAVDHEKAELPKEMTESVVKEEEVLGWNRNDDYMDKSHGTEIGDSAPFDDAEARNIDDGDKQVNKTGEMKNGTVEEGTSMHDADNQNTPTPGVGEVGDNQPFDGEKGKQIDEAFDDFGGEEEPIGDEIGAEEGEPMDDELAGGEEELGDEIGAEGDEIADDEMDDEVYEDDTESRLDAMEELLSQIAAKLGVSEAPVDDAAYGDDELFDDEEGDDFGDEEAPIEDELNMDMPMENKRRNGVQVYETKAYRQAMREGFRQGGRDNRLRLDPRTYGGSDEEIANYDEYEAARRAHNRQFESRNSIRTLSEEGMKPFKDAGRVPSGNMNKLDDFGKHPAYQKKVMELPPKDMKEFPGYYDMNDDSVRNDTPYGEKIGDGAPFEIDPQAIDNAIAESFNRLFRNKKKI